jgi:hypothetical protein
MDPRRKATFTGTLLCLATLLAAMPGRAQQAPALPAQPATPAAPTVAPAAVDIEPGVNTSATSAPAASAPATSAPATSASRPARAATPARGAARPAGRAQDRVDLDATQITGNRELPRVLYIVPWKRSDLGDLTGKPVNSLLDEVLAPVDRDVFKRETRYFDAVSAAPPTGAAGAGAAGSPPAAGATPVGDSVRDGSQAPEPGGQ